MLRPSLFLATALAFSPLVASQWFTEDEVSNRYILYNGTISGTFEHGSNYPSSCKDIKLGTFKNTLLAVGVYPEWDTNPFFFDLYHSTSEGGGGLISFTDDSIYNLQFTSAASVCMKDGEVCGTIAFDPTWKPTQLLDLNKATVKKTNIKGDAGYSVSGDKSSWAGDEKVKNEVDIAGPEGTDFDCLLKEHFAWNASTPFKYDIGFTNSSSKAELSITGPHGSLNLNFAGDRVDNAPKEFASVGTPIELDASDSSTPKFKNVDGSKVSFDDDDNDGSGDDSDSGSSYPTGTTGSGSDPGTETDSGSSSTQTGGSEALIVKSSMAYWAAGSVVAFLGAFI